MRLLPEKKKLSPEEKVRQDLLSLRIILGLLVLQCSVYLGGIWMVAYINREFSELLTDYSQSLSDYSLVLDRLEAAELERQSRATTP